LIMGAQPLLAKLAPAGPQDRRGPQPVNGLRPFGCVWRVDSRIAMPARATPRFEHPDDAGGGGAYPENVSCVGNGLVAVLVLMQCAGWHALGMPMLVVLIIGMPVFVRD